MMALLSLPLSLTFGLPFDQQPVEFPPLGYGMKFGVKVTTRLPRNCPRCDSLGHYLAFLVIAGAPNWMGAIVLVQTQTTAFDIELIKLSETN